MENYLQLARDILDNGTVKENRTGINTKAVFGRMLRFDLSKGFPIITTRKTTLRIAFEETMMFLRGQTDTTILEEKDITIWQGNTTREFLDKQNLQHLPVGSLGTGYSHQWRNFNGTLGQQNGVDQIKELFEGLKNNPTSRRHIVSAWNPSQLHGTPLPPCHILQQYNVNGNKLDSLFFMRSNDVYHGLPFNIMGYAFLNMVFAKALQLTPGELVYMGGDVHIYENQIENMQIQLTREPRPLPTLEIKKELNSLEDILALEYKDLKLVGYNPWPALTKVRMAV